jgi:hypothetical protein
MAAIAGLRVNQWLPEWDNVQPDAESHQSEPPHEFYLASISASKLRALATVHQRSVEGGVPRAEDPNVQRTLQTDRTAEISRYIQVGYPLSSINPKKLAAGQEASLQKPGWLPTAIIANVIPAGHSRGALEVAAIDEITVRPLEGSDSFVSINLPSSWSDDDRTWMPQGASPLEIIDGQHRLSAFDADGDDDFELPVVLFTGLDFSWQAYLFWTVNIKPKKINASLAYDLYPLLRKQDWLEAGESLNVYRETRSQELVEALWNQNDSVWRDRINMLGQPGMKAERPVSQAAFIRSLTATLVRPFFSYRQLGGLFGGAEDNTGLRWRRGQQSAFMVYAWGELAHAIFENESSEWVRVLRQSEYAVNGLFAYEPRGALDDPAFVGERSLLTTDQGIRGFHFILNDLAYLGRDDLHLAAWSVRDDLEASSEAQYNEALVQLQTNEVGDFLRRLARVLATFDWRTAKAPGLSPEEIDRRRGLRGSGGYNVLRGWLLNHVASSDDALLADLARRAEELYGA